MTSCGLLCHRDAVGDHDENLMNFLNSGGLLHRAVRRHICDVILQAALVFRKCTRIVYRKKQQNRSQRPPNPAPANQSLFPRLQEPTPESGVRPYYEASNPRGASWSRYVKEQIGYLRFLDTASRFRVIGPVAFPSLSTISSIFRYVPLRILFY
jgi:hypothetical protein